LGKIESDFNLLIGDVNNDSAINVVDVVIIVSIILEEIPITDQLMSLADLNSDSAINVSDIAILVSIILGS